MEHNNLHHYRLSEADDPDLVERNLGIIRNAPLPMIFKCVGLGLWGGLDGRHSRPATAVTFEHPDHGYNHPDHRLRRRPCPRRVLLTHPPPTCSP